MKNLIVITVAAAALSACAIARDFTVDNADEAAPWLAEYYNAYCRIADLEVRQTFRDEVQKSLDEINSGLIAPNFDCDGDGVGDLPVTGVSN